MSTEKKQSAQPLGKTLTRWDYDDSVCRITLNAPKANILDSQMMREIADVLRQLRSRPQCKLLVLQAEGPHFSFGASVEEHRPENAADMLKQFHSLFSDIMELSIPALAAVRGQCLGGGMELACFCHYVFAEITAMFGVPEIQLGVFPPPASAFLPLKLGQSQADWMILNGASLTAEKALHIGLIHHLSQSGQLEADVNAFIEKNILPKSASSLRHAAKAGRWLFNRQVTALLDELEDYYLSHLMKTYDACEGINAFLEKRPPRWEGK